MALNNHKSGHEFKVLHFYIKKYVFNILLFLYGECASNSAKKQFIKYKYHCFSSIN